MALPLAGRTPRQSACTASGAQREACDRGTDGCTAPVKGMCGLRTFRNFGLAESGSLFGPDKVLVRRSTIQRRAGPHVVVRELVLGELGRDAGDGEGAVAAAPEPDAGGPVGALDAPPWGGLTSPPGRDGRNSSGMRSASQQRSKSAVNPLPPSRSGQGLWTLWTTDSGGPNGFGRPPDDYCSVIVREDPNSG